MRTRFWWGNLRARDHLEDLDLNGSSYEYKYLRYRMGLSDLR
jgi:hypothetical protein